MGGSDGLTTCGHHLVEGTAMGKLGIQLLAEFTRPAGACVETMDNGRVDVFHGEVAPERRKQIRPVVRQGHSSSACKCFFRLLTEAFVLQATGTVQAPRGRREFRGFNRLK